MSLAIGLAKLKEYVQQIRDTSNSLNGKVTKCDTDDVISRPRLVEGSALGGSAITISGANPSVTATIDLGTSKAKIKRIVVVRTAQSGTAYTSNSRTVEIFDKSGANSESVYSIYKQNGLEPDSTTGRLINETDKVNGEIIFNNHDSPQGNNIYVTISASGGDGTSSETYEVIIQGEEMA